MSTPVRKEIRTMCPMNCYPTFCGMTATVEGDQLIGVRGDRDNPDSRGFLCVRGQASREIIGNDKRILYPMMREQRGTDNWRRIEWDEALQRITTSIKAVTPDSVGLWPGHGSISNDYGPFAHAELAQRLASMYGMQLWDPSMVCWGLGGFGIGLTGVMEVNTREDMGANADLILIWGSNIASQPTTAHQISAAKSRGARIVAIDVRVTEACRLAHEYFIIKPGTDAALALALMHVIVTEDLHDKTFIAQHTLGFDALREQLPSMTPDWAAAITGIEAGRIASLARDYAATDRAMILLGGSSMYKDSQGWQASRAISCLPPLTGKLGRPGTGFGLRHAGTAHGFGLSHINNLEARPRGDYIPNQMSAMLEGFESGKLRVFVLFGSNLLSSFADANRLARGMEKMDLIVVHDLFMNDTARRYADIMLPATAWLEDVGVKATTTHLYLMEKAMEPAGEARSMATIVRSLAASLGVEGFYPWDHDYGHIDAVLDHPSTGHATLASLRQQHGIRALNISHVAHIDHQYPTPSGKIEFYSERAAQHGLPALPAYQPRPLPEYPLELRSGRTLDHFHAFYDHGRALPSMHKLEQGPTLWISADDAGPRGIEDGVAIRIYNDSGECAAIARVTADVAAGTVWMHDGWPGLNSLTSGRECLPEGVTSMFPFSVGQAAYDAFVEVSPAG